MFKKPRVGYKKTKKEKESRSSKRRYLSDLVLYKPGGSRVSFMERVVKILIYFALRLVIRPKRWKDPEKNYEIIDRTYKRIMSSDFIFIPSSVAFYIIMAFMPVISIITLFWMIPGADLLVTKKDMEDIVGKFIPGFASVVEGMKDFTSSGSIASKVGGGIALFVSLLISTWIAAGGFAKLVYTQSYIYEHKFVGGYWMNKIKGMFMVLSLTAFLLAGLIVNVLYLRWNSTFTVGETARQIIHYTVMFFGLLAMLFFGFILLYKFSPRYRIRVRHVIPGAMVTALPTTIFLTLFGIITSHWSYSSYGIIAVIMYIGMTSLIVSNFIFMGLITNAAYYKTFVGNAVEKKWTLSRK